MFNVQCIWLRSSVNKYWAQSRFCISFFALLLSQVLETPHINDIISKCAE